MDSIASVMVVIEKESRLDAGSLIGAFQNIMFSLLHKCCNLVLLQTT